MNWDFALGVVTTICAGFIIALCRASSAMDRQIAIDKARSIAAAQQATEDINPRTLNFDSNCPYCLMDQASFRVVEEIIAEGVTIGSVSMEMENKRC